MSAWDGAPDLAEPIVGFRQWRIVDGALHSPWADARWTSSELRAACGLGGHPTGTVPAKECSCGLYAYYDPCPRTASLGTPDFVAGAVIVWGTIELHATGMRAAHARIVALELPIFPGRKRRTLAGIAAQLDVSLAPHVQLRAAAATYGLPLQRSLRPGSNDAPGFRPLRHHAGRGASPSRADPEIRLRGTAG